MHSVASSTQGHAVGSVVALFGWSSASSMVVGWTVAGGSTSGQSEGAVVGCGVLLTLGSQACWGVLYCHGNQVVVVVPDILPLLHPVGVGVLGRATVQGSFDGRGIGRQAALLLVVHECLLVGPGY